MKAIITNVTFAKEFESKFGPLFSFKVEYDGKSAYYSSKKKEQDKFVKGKECEFTEEKRTGKNGEYFIVKPVGKNPYNSNFGKALQREQSKYSGFAVSYVKDLIISGHIDIKQWKSASKDIFNFMVDLDKSIQS